MLYFHVWLQNKGQFLVPSPWISAFFAAANKMPRWLNDKTFCLGTSLAALLPRLVGFYIKSLGIYLGNLGKNIDEKQTCKVTPSTPYFTKNKTYYVYNSIQNFKRSVVYIQNKVSSSTCSSVRNNNYNPFQVYEK